MCVCMLCCVQDCRLLFHRFCGAPLDLQGLQRELPAPVPGRARHGHAAGRPAQDRGVVPRLQHRGRAAARDRGQHRGGTRRGARHRGPQRAAGGQLQRVLCPPGRANVHLHAPRAGIPHGLVAPGRGGGFRGFSGKRFKALWDRGCHAFSSSQPPSGFFTGFCAACVARLGS
jgi:hypothetical protein